MKNGIVYGYDYDYCTLIRSMHKTKLLSKGNQRKTLVHYLHDDDDIFVWVSTLASTGGDSKFDEMDRSRATGVKCGFPFCFSLFFFPSLCVRVFSFFLFVLRFVFLFYSLRIITLTHVPLCSLPCVYF